MGGGGGEREREFRPFTKYLSNLCIIHRLICPHAHHQNGVVERKHRHIVDLGLTLLIHASLPLKFWDYAFLTTVYLINRLPTASLHNAIPDTILFKQTPGYNFLKVFGCACFPLLRPYNTHKFDFRSHECLFLGYSTSHKGYNVSHLVEDSLSPKMSYSMSIDSHITTYFSTPSHLSLCPKSLFLFLSFLHYQFHPLPLFLFPLPSLVWSVQILLIFPHHCSTPPINSLLHHYISHLLPLHLDLSLHPYHSLPPSLTYPQILLISLHLTLHFIQLLQ